MHNDYVADLIRAYLRPLNGETMSCEPKTITMDELKGAIRRMGVNGPGCAIRLPYYASVDSLAADLFNSIMEHREPCWLDGDVVKAANGQFFQRSDGYWITWGTTCHYPHDFPKRPLTKVS